jgi:glycerol-3-phosphate dehydrogenase
LKAAGLRTSPNPNFNPNRAPIIIPKSGWKGIRAGPWGKYTDPKENVVCKCEKVTEAEIVDAMHRSLPIDSTQAMRKRTRAGMGNCQGREDNYNCECRVAEIIRRETNASAAKAAQAAADKAALSALKPMQLPAHLVGRRPWPATNTIPERWPTEEQRDALREYSK